MLNFDEKPLNSQKYINVVNTGILWEKKKFFVCVSKREVPIYLM